MGGIDTPNAAVQGSVHHAQRIEALPLGVTVLCTLAPDKSPELQFQVAVW